MAHAQPLTTITATRPGWRRYVYSTNHKDIGTMYLWFAIFAGIIGGILSVVMRMELAGARHPVFPRPRPRWSMARRPMPHSTPASTCTTCSSPATACS